MTRSMRPAADGDPWTLTDTEKRRIPGPSRYYPPTQPPTLQGDELTDEQARGWDIWETYRDKYSDAV